MFVLAAASCLFAVSCMTVDRHGAFIIDTPQVVKEHKIIENKILPYIAEVLDYNNPSGTDDPQAAQYFRTIRTVNNMNYDKFVDCQDYALLFYALCQYYHIDCKLVGNPTLRHAYNQLNVRGHAVDVEPQSGEGTVYFVALHGWKLSENGLFVKRINTHPDNMIMDIDEWNAYGKEGRFVSPANMELFNYVVKNGHLPNWEMRSNYPLPDLLTGNSVTMLAPSIGYNYSSYSIDNTDSSRKSNQFLLGFDMLGRAPNGLSYTVGGNLSMGGKISESLNALQPKQWETTYNAFSSVLSAYILPGYTFNVKDFYLTAEGGIGFSATVFEKTSFLSFMVPIGLELKYYFTRDFGISVTGMWSWGIGALITASEIPAANASEFFLLASMVHPTSTNFSIKIGPTVRIPGQKGLGEKIRALQNRR